MFTNILMFFLLLFSIFIYEKHYEANNIHFYFWKISEVQILADIKPSFWFFLLIVQIWELECGSLSVLAIQFKHS